MARRSQRHLRYMRGFDSSGTTAYMLGETSVLSAADQYAAAVAAGWSPPAP